jgi:hypothetical protein
MLAIVLGHGVQRRKPVLEEAVVVVVVVVDLAGEIATSVPKSGTLLRVSCQW